MELEEGKQKFIQAWGTLGSKWGINRTMAQVQALLLLAPEAMSADEVMAALQISRGNANTSLRGLIDWGVVSKIHKPGERREYFVAEKDMWEVTRQVIIERRRRELEPVLRMLEDVKDVTGDKKDPEMKEFLSTTKDLSKFAGKIDKAFDRMIRADENLISKAMLGFLLK